MFSFGAVLYEMATGELPFHGESSAVICEAIMNRAPVAVVRLNHDVPPKLEDIINRALEKDRELRYQHAADMRSELQRLKRDTETGRAIAASSGTVAAAPESGSNASRPTAVASIRLLSCWLLSSSSSAVKVSRGFCRWQETLESSGSRRRDTCRRWQLWERSTFAHARQHQRRRLHRSRRKTRLCSPTLTTRQAIPCLTTR